jgi:endonuclease/exonuclease/phosphatase family metal-dependent hydrolase
VKLRLLSYNIRFGGSGREEQLAAVIRATDADVVLLQEATDPVVVSRVAERARMPHWGSRPGHSTGFLSRVPVEKHEWIHPRGTRHAFLEVVLAECEYRLFALHLSAWFSKWSERRRAREIRSLLEGIREHQHGLHLIAGDFNALAPGEVLNAARMPRWIRAMVWVSGRDIARETIQTMLDEGYVDAWRHLHAGEAGYTFPTWDPHVRLDYVFAPARYSEGFTHCSVVTTPLEAQGASDHYPLLAVMDWSERAPRVSGGS